MKNVNYMISKYHTKPNKIQGTWIHRKVAYNLAQWISSSFAVQVSKILDELFILGKVELNKEHSSEEITNEFIKRIHNLEDNSEIKDKIIENKNKRIKELEKNYDKMKYKRTCHKFKEGSAVYIFKTFSRHKIGKASTVKPFIVKHTTFSYYCFLFFYLIENIVNKKLNFNFLLILNFR